MKIGHASRVSCAFWDKELPRDLVVPDTVNPKRIALIGLTPDAHFVAEACRLSFQHLAEADATTDLTGTNVEIVAVADSADADRFMQPGCIHPLFRDKAVSMDELLPRRDVEFVVVTSPLERRLVDVQRALKAGHHVRVIAPVGTSTNEWRAALATARAAGTSLRAVSLQPDSTDFHQAQRVVQSGQLGRLRQINFTWRQVADFALPRNESARPKVGIVEEMAHRCWQQLAQLVPGRVVRVFGIINRGQLCFDSLSTCGATPESPTPAHESGFLAVMEFENGCVAQLEVDLASSTTLAPQWRLQGDRGGYLQGKQSLIEADGEVFEVDVKIDRMPTMIDDWFMIMESQAELDRQAAIADWVDAVRSSDGHQVVTLGLDERLRRT